MQTDFATTERFVSIVDNAIMGAVTGGVMGAPGGVVTAPETAPVGKRPGEAAREPPEEEPAAPEGAAEPEREPVEGEVAPAGTPGGPGRGRSASSSPGTGTSRPWCSPETGISEAEPPVFDEEEPPPVAPAAPTEEPAPIASVVYASQAHSEMLPAVEGKTEYRAGMMLGDGTGVGVCGGDKLDHGSGGICPAACGVKLFHL